MSTVPGFTLLSNFPFGLLKKIPVPGLDVALGVTVYQIAEMARATTLAATRSRRVSGKLASDFSKNIRRIGRSRRRIREHGEEVIQHTVRGAMHAIDEKPMEANGLIKQIVEGAASAAEETGIEALDSVRGVGQGVVQGAVEMGIDVTRAIEIAVDIVRKSSSDIGISEDEALTGVTAGALRAAEQIGSEVVAEVVEGVPEEHLPIDSEE
jgi:hypothetical protein